MTRHECVLVKLFLGTVWQRTWDAVSTYSPCCLLRPTELTMLSPSRPPPAPQKAAALYMLSSPEQDGWEMHIYLHSHLLVFLSPPRLTSAFGQGDDIYHSTIENTGQTDLTWQMHFGTIRVINHQLFASQGSQICFLFSCLCNDTLLCPFRVLTLHQLWPHASKLSTTGSVFSHSLLCLTLHAT